MTAKKKKLTTSFGAPVSDDQNSLTAGPTGPVLLQDVHLIDKLAHFNRERIPERIVHAKGGGFSGILRSLMTSARTRKRSSSQKSVNAPKYSCVSPRLVGKKDQQMQSVILVASVSYTHLTLPTILLV